MHLILVCSLPRPLENALIGAHHLSQHLFNLHFVRRHTDYGRLPHDQQLVSGIKYIPIGDDMQLPAGEVRRPTPLVPQTPSP